MANQRLRGLVGQRMDGRRRLTGGWVELLRMTDANVGGAITAPTSCVALIFAWGGGGAGASGGTGSAGCGGPGAALYRRVRLGRGQIISYSVGGGGSSVEDAGTAVAGNAGSATIVTLPGRLTLTAGGGQGGTPGSGDGAGGVAIGGELNLSSTAGAGAPTFAHLYAALAGGATGTTASDGTAGSWPGGGGGAGNGGFGHVSGAGAGGRVFIILAKTL